MAKNSSLVLLGYEDESVNEKQKNFLDFSTNKIGGKPVSRTMNKKFSFKIYNKFFPFFFMYSIPK